MIEIKKQNTRFNGPLPQSCSQRAPPSKNVARAAFALLEKLDSGRRRPPPSIPKVFRLYCIDALSAAEVARKCRCSKAAVIRRLNLSGGLDVPSPPRAKIARAKEKMKYFALCYLSNTVCYPFT